MEANFQNYLKKENVSEALQSVLMDIISVFPQVARALKGSQLGYAETQNVYGEQQLKLDVLSNNLFVSVLQKNKYVSMLASEELESEITGLAAQGLAADGLATDEAANEAYSVAFDPLDGSSLVDVNLAVGSIFGIYKGEGFIGKKGSEQVAAVIAVYGPRLTFMISVGSGVVEFIYQEEQNEFVQSGVMKVADEKKMFAPGNLRACSSEAWYISLMEYWLKNEYTLRYSGGMVPDINQILRKGGGVFTYPGYKGGPDGKLRLLYECAPMAYLMENAGGSAMWARVSEKGENGKVAAGTVEQGRILDLDLTKLDQRTPIFLGSKKEVETALGFMKA